MLEDEPVRTRFTREEIDEIETNFQALKFGTSRLIAVTRERNPRITTSQADTISGELDVIIRNLRKFQDTVRDLTD